MSLIMFNKAQLYKPTAVQCSTNITKSQLLPNYIHKKLRKSPEMRSHESTNTTHILLLITFLLLIIKIVKTMDILKEPKTPAKQFSSIQLKLQTGTLYLIFMRNNKLNPRTEKHYRMLCLLLIILANDIHPHPGPKPAKPDTSKTTCTMCTKEFQKNEDLLECQSCQKW